jgi:hypothetical protein
MFTRSEIEQCLCVPSKQFSLSFGARPRRSIQSVPALFHAKGQSAEKMMRSIPISATLHANAASEKFPLVVRWKCLRKVSLNVMPPQTGRDRSSSMRQRRNGSPSPRWPSTIINPGYSSNTPLRIIRIACVAVSTVKPHTGPINSGYRRAYAPEPDHRQRWNVRLAELTCGTANVATELQCGSA